MTKLRNPTSPGADQALACNYPAHRGELCIADAGHDDAKQRRVNAPAIDRVGQLLARRETIAAQLKERASWDGAKALRAATEYSYDLRDELKLIDDEVETLLFKSTGFSLRRRLHPDI